MTTEQNPREKGVNVARLVDRLSKDISMMSAPNHSAANAAAAGAANSAQKGDVHLRKAHQNQIVPAPPPPQQQQQQQHSPHKQQPQQQHGRSVVACFSYSAQMDDELDLREGDQIDVLEDVEDGWARGEIISSAHIAAQGRVGLFPTNFALPVSTGVPSNNGAVNVPKVAPAITPKVKEMAKVVYIYEAANPDELSLPEGALVTVLNKNCEDEGWYEGELNGRRGLFPENFVKLLPPVLTSSPNAAAAPVSPTVSEKASPLSAAPAQPPTLPAKPKTTSQRASTHVPSSAAHSAAPPVARFRDSAFASFTPTSSASGGNSTSSDTTNSVSEKSPASAVSPAAAKIVAASDERKSMVAGLQSLLFPQGKLPPVPHKSPSAVAAAAATGSAEKDDVADESRLSSLTKNRPKQSNKRPPSLSVRQSVLQPKVLTDDSSPTGQSTAFPSSSSTGSIASTKMPSSSGISTSAKSTKTAPIYPSVPAAPSTTKSLNSSELATKQQQANSITAETSPAAATAVDGGEVTALRAEFDTFRQETTREIDELKRQVAELTTLLKNAQK